jgi:glutamyl-tRNA synthetase/nondiscriminating glutamyl-tRNA synthetase
VGNARTALFNWLLARGHGGTFILRIEDTDVERSTRESEQAIIDDLRWLGLEWDEGPDVHGPRGPYRQSERLHLYASYAKELVGNHHAYYCFCSATRLEAERQAALAAGRPPRYSGRCRSIPHQEAAARVESGASAVVRFKVPDAGEVSFRDLVRGDVRFNVEVIGDPVLVRSDGRPAYNFAVVIDDALMEVTHVIRGEDHISNTPRQLLLYRALGFKPPQFAHLALVMGPDHSPLSKRHGATSVAEFREKGYLPEALVNYLALIGWSPGDNEELLPVRELARRFSLDAVGHSAGVFDEEKLAWVNRHYMKLADPLRIGAEAMRYFQRLGFVRRSTSAALDYLATLLPMAAGSVDRLNEIPARVKFVFDYDATASLAREDVREVLHEGGAREVIDALAQELASRDRLLSKEAFRAAAAKVRERTGQKGRALFHPIRVALTGEPAGPELDLAIPAIEHGAALSPDAGVRPILGCRERAEAFVSAAAAWSSTE